MGFKCGIVGLPNVGKSTLFNALTQTAAAQAANYPFCTIEPNVGEIAVPDPRLDVLAKLGQVGEQIVPTRLSFVDIAGLVQRRVEGRGARQPVPRQHPRGRRHRPRGALLQGRRRHPCRRQHRSGRRHRDDRNRADARRPRQPGEARRPPGEESQGQRRGGERSQGDARSDQGRRWRFCAKASRRASSSASPRRRRCFTCSACSPRCRCSTSATSTRLRPRPATSYRSRSRRGPRPRARAASRSRPRSRPRSRRCRPTSAEHFLADLGLEETGLDRLIRAGYDAAALVTYFTAGPEAGARPGP